MKFSRKSIYNALPIVAAAYSERFGVKVFIGNDASHASTDGKTVTIPNVPPDYPFMDVVWGYLAHEGGHLRFTDFSVPLLSPLHKYLTNVIEDCRIECAMIKEFPGTAQTLNAMAEYIINKGFYAHVTTDESPVEIVTGYCLYWLQSEIVGQTMIRPYAEQAFRALQLALPIGVSIRLQMLLRKVPSLTSTAGAANLASDIISMLKEEQEKAEQQQDGNSNDPNPPQSQPENGQGQGQNQSQSGNGENGSNDGKTQPGDSSGQSQAVSTDSSDQGQGSLPGQDQTKSGNGSASNHSTPGQAPTNQDMAARFGQLLNASDADMPANAQRLLANDLKAAEMQGGDPSYRTVRQAIEIPNNTTGHELLSRVKGNSSRIRQQLFALVQAQSRQGRRTERQGKRLDYTRLSRVMTGDFRVFVQSSEKRYPNTAVHLLVDASGSMNAEVNNDICRGDIARESALSIALALEAISGVNPAVTFFGHEKENPVHFAVKHGERVQPNAGRFMMTNGGGTPMAEAIWYSAFELSKTREQRKMLVVITDGDPSNRPAVKSVVDLCEASEMEVIGIGVETEAVTGLFSRTIVINDPSDLRNTLFKLMENALAVAA
ncbi:VWA domain-containing protein [Eoetvoesiella caeni]